MKHYPAEFKAAAVLRPGSPSTGARYQRASNFH